MYTSKDIRCFIITRNRADLLEESLNSLVKQKGGPWDIWVIDNSTEDKTEILIKTKYPAVHYERTQGGEIFVANTERTQALADTPYVLTLHDDDLLAPNYLQNVLKAINSYPDIAGVFAKYHIFKNKNIPDQALCDHQDTEHWLIKNQAEFALCFWGNPSPCWSGSVLKSELYKKVDIKKELNNYGKIFDWPFLINITGNNNALIFTDYYIYYRVHPKQHTCDDNSGIKAKQLSNWLRFFKNFAETKQELKNIYILRAYENAISNYKSFLSKKEQKICRDLPSWFIKENLNVAPMKFYHKILSSKILHPLKHIFKRIYKRNYFKKFITDFK